MVAKFKETASGWKFDVVSSALARAPFGERVVSGLLSLCRAPDYFYRTGGGRTDPKPIA